MRRLAGAGLAALLLSACHAERRLREEPSWAGATFQLRESPTHALSVDGVLKGEPPVPVEVRFEVARALSMASQSCFRSAPKQKRVVHVPLAAGGFEASEEAELPDLKLGRVELPSRQVAKVPDPGPCVVTLGVDVLGNQAFELDLDHHALRFVPPYTSSVGPEGPESRGGTAAGPFVVELSRDPRTDFLLMPVSLRGDQGKQTLSPFLISLGLETSVISRSAAQRLGAGETDPKLVPEEVELVPGLSRSDVEFTVTGSWKNEQTAGILGRDVWKGMKMTVDLPARRILLVPGAGFGGARGQPPDRARKPAEDPEPEEPGNSG